MGESSGHKHSKNRRGRYVLSLVLSFLITVALTLGAVLGGTAVVFFKENTLIRSLGAQNYYKAAEEGFHKHLVDMSVPVGIPEEVLIDVADSDTFYHDIKESVRQAIKGHTYIPDTTAVKRTLKEHVRTYFAGQKLTMTEAQSAALDAYAESVGEAYADYIKIPILQYYGKVYPVFQKIQYAGLPACAVFVLTAVFFLWRMYYYKHRALRFLIYSTLSAGMMTGILPLVLLVKGDYLRLSIEPEYFYQFVATYITRGLWIFVWIGAAFWIISAFLLLIVRGMKSKL